MGEDLTAGQLLHEAMHKHHIYQDQIKWEELDTSLQLEWNDAAHMFLKMEPSLRLAIAVAIKDSKQQIQQTLDAMEEKHGKGF